MTDHRIADRIETLVAEEYTSLRTREEAERNDDDALGSDRSRLSEIAVEVSTAAGTCCVNGARSAAPAAIPTTPARATQTRSRITSSSRHERGSCGASDQTSTSPPTTVFRNFERREGHVSAGGNLAVRGG